MLAISAFGVLPESVDGWVTETLTRTPLRGFLLFSSVYGLAQDQERPGRGVRQVMARRESRRSVMS